MTGYRVHLLDDETVQHSFEMAFEGDDDAVLHTALQTLGCAVEIWQGDRKVHRFNAGDLAN
jgi:hypothetical protein